MNLTKTEQKIYDAIQRLLDRNEPISIRKIEKESGVKRNNLSSYVKSLHEKGVISYVQYQHGKTKRVNYQTVKTSEPERTAHNSLEDRLITLSKLLAGASIEAREIAESLDQKESAKDLLGKLMNLVK